MNTRQDVALRYHDKKVIGNISDEGSCVYILIPHSRRIKHAPKCYGAKSLSKFIQFMKLKYLVINAPDQLKLGRQEKICRAERTAQKDFTDEKRDDNSKNDKDINSNVSFYQVIK